MIERLGRSGFVVVRQGLIACRADAIRWRIPVVDWLAELREMLEIWGVHLATHPDFGHIERVLYEARFL